MLEKLNIETELNIYNQVFNLYDCKGLLNSKSYFKTILGSIPILVSCPHTVMLDRGSKLKPAEFLTGALGLLLQDLTDCYLIYTVKNDIVSPSNISGSDYREKIISLVQDYNIKYFIDLHGAASWREFDIDLGTDNGNSINEKHTNKFIEIFNKNYIDKVYENHTFHADHNGTLTYFTSMNLGIDSIQVEVNGKYRNIRDNDSIMKLLNSLVEFIDYLNIKEIDD